MITKWELQRRIDLAIREERENLRSCLADLYESEVYTRAGWPSWEAYVEGDLLPRFTRHLPPGPDPEPLVTIRVLLLSVADEVPSAAA